MKKTILLAVICAGTFSVVFAQKKVSVPSEVLKAFKKSYPEVNPKWENEHGKYEAGFKKDGHSISLLYKADGALEETEVSIPVAELSPKIVKYVKEHQLGEIKEAAKITKANGEVNYEAEVKSGDALFDVNGNFLKIAKD